MLNCIYTYLINNTLSQMKKTLFTLLIMVLACFAGAQTVLNETFSGGTFPPTGWTTDTQAGNWSSGNSENA